MARKRAMSKERLRLGRLYKLRTGQLMHNAPPYGYRYVPIAEQGGGRWFVDEREAEADAQETVPDELGRLQARQHKLERQWTRLLDAFQEELLDKAELAQRKQRLDQERQTLAERIEQIQQQQVQQSLENPTPQVKQEVLRLLVESVNVEDDAITIKHIIPTDDCCRLLPRGNM